MEKNKFGGLSAIFLLALIVHVSAYAQWGSFTKPFSADSPWNVRPVNPIFGAFVLPTGVYFPSIGGGAYSTNFYQAYASDPPKTVYPKPGTSTINLVYSQAASVTIPHWPATATPAPGTDGHLDILDTTTGVIHSLFEAKIASSGAMTASQYNRTRVDGRGWGDTALFYQGARATGVPPIGGLIRSHEITDGDSTYRHALAMTLPKEALQGAPGTGFVFPATSSDDYYQGVGSSANTGQIPEGALMMLPPSFNTSSIVSSKMKKVAETLKVYGARVVDRNVGTPFAIAVEGITDTFALHNSYPDCPPSSCYWSGTAAADLQAIRASLRMVVGTSGWIDGNGSTAADLNRKVRMVAGRGTPQGGANMTGAYDPINDRINISTSNAYGYLTFPETINPGVTPLWSAGATYRFSVETSNPNIIAMLQLFTTGSNYASTPLTTNGQTTTIVAPAGLLPNYSIVTVYAPANTSGWIRVSAVQQ